MAKPQTDIVCLRAPTDADAAVHASFPPDAEIVRMYGGSLSHAAKPSLARSRAWVQWLQDQPFAKIVEWNGNAVGHVRLHSLSQVDQKARLAIGLFAQEFLARGIGRRAIALTLDHAFGEMALHRVDLRVLAFNTRAIRCYRACGFSHEGTEREAAWIDGKWHDDWIMGILSTEFQAHR